MHSHVQLTQSTWLFECVMCVLPLQVACLTRVMGVPAAICPGPFWGVSMRPRLGNIFCMDVYVRIPGWFAHSMCFRRDAKELELSNLFFVKQCRKMAFATQEYNDSV